MFPNCALIRIIVFGNFNPSRTAKEAKHVQTGCSWAFVVSTSYIYICLWLHIYTHAYIYIYVYRHKHTCPYVHISFSFSLCLSLSQLIVFQHVLDWCLIEARGGDRRKVLCIPNGEEGQIRTALEAHGAIAASQVSCDPPTSLLPCCCLPKQTPEFCFRGVCDCSHVQYLFGVTDTVCSFQVR